MLQWSARARADLKSIHDHIAKDSPRNAKDVARDIRKLAGEIPDTPRADRVVPELNDPTIREIPAHSWRVIYQLREQQVFIITLVHKRRATTAEQLNG